MAHAMARAATRAFIVTDIHNVERKVSTLRGGAPVSSTHQYLWSSVRRAIHKVAVVRWVMAHPTEAEAAARGIPLP